MDQALFGPSLASSVLDLLEEKLQGAMKATEELRKVPLGAVDPVDPTVMAAMALQFSGEQRDPRLK